MWVVSFRHCIVCMHCNQWVLGRCFDRLPKRTILLTKQKYSFSCYALYHIFHRYKTKTHTRCRRGWDYFVTPRFGCSSSNPSTKTKSAQGRFNFCGGWGGIRTPGGLAPSTVFKTAAFDRSATHPKLAVVVQDNGHIIYYFFRNATAKSVAPAINMTADSI